MAQGMLGNLVKDVRNVNHLQSDRLSHWSILLPPELLHWSLVYFCPSRRSAAAQQDPAESVFLRALQTLPEQNQTK